ncbi:hypothetical protein BKA61DRAFT_735062 [Leptodontidium sp. MPI-SDFR-AT-0119]|nr:hypothetical protein BKA61DRAFT_735062 [Leptodontidium sp. MPI-SDFR-AT-0119]
MSEQNNQDGQDGPKYVIDSMFGGTALYDDVVGPGAPEDRASHERVWPAIPAEYCPPPPEIENALKEVQCILGYLKRFLTPTPLPEDDLELMSDYLLSMETRDDLTALVLKQTEAESAINMVSRILLKDDTKYNFKSRAEALLKHWYKLRSSILKYTPEEMLADRPLAPFKTDLPDDKPAEWKLDLGEARTAEAQRQLELLKMEKNRCVKYWTTVKPPRVMGWAPVDGEAWKKVSRTDLENGNLFFSPYFSPIWESYGLAQMDAMFWTDPDQTPEEEAEHEKLKVEQHEMLELARDMRRVRLEHAQSLGFKGGW